MKVTQKEFASAMTENLTIFAGRTQKMLCPDEVYSTFTDYLKGGIFERRSCKAHSKALEFSGGSWLYLTGNKYGKYEFPEFDVYYCECYDKGGFDLWVVLWYLIEK